MANARPVTSAHTRSAYACIDAHVNEAQLLAETEELLNCLEPAAFVLNSSQSSTSTSKHYAAASALVAATDAAAPTVPAGSMRTETASPPSSSPSSSSSPTSIALGAQKARGRRSWKANAMRNPSRERLQNELVTLRQQASELEAELTLARRHQAELERSRRLVLPNWEPIAKRQLVSRSKSERENKRLRTLIESQRVFVAQLQHAWYRWQRMTRLDPFSAVVGATVRFTANDPAIFEMLAANLDLEYMRMQEVFCDAGLMRQKFSPLMNREARTRLLSNGEAAPVLELSSVEVDPYDFRLLSQASWQIVRRQGTLRNRVLFTDLAVPELTSAVKMRIPSMQNGKQVFLEELCVTKRYFEKDSTTYVWRSITREEDNGGTFPDTFIEETGWIMMKDRASLEHAPLSSGSGRGSTVTLTCLQLEPKRVRGMTPPVGEVAVCDPFAALVLENFASDVEEINTMIDGLILDMDETKAPPGADAAW